MSEKEKSVGADENAVPEDAYLADQAEAEQVQPGRPSMRANLGRIASDGGSRRVLVFAAVALAALAGALVLAYTQQQSIEPSSVSRAPRLDATPGGERQQESPRYQEILERANAEEAENALNEGRNFMPTIEAVPQDIDRDGISGDEGQVAEVEPREREQAVPASIIPTRAVIPEPAPVTPVQQQIQQPSTTSASQENPYTESIASQAAMIMSSWATRPAGATVFPKPDPQEQANQAALIAALTGAPAPQAGQQQVANNTTSTAGTAQFSGGEVLVAAGGIVHAQMVNTVKSDTPGMVLADIVTGPLSGGRLIGAFSVGQGAEGMQVVFNSLVMSDGRSTPVSALAIDGITADSLVASSVDQRWIQRYGPTLAASFVTGAAEAVANAGVRISESDRGTVTSMPETVDFNQAVAAGLAEAGGMVAGDISANAPTGPLVTLASGYPLAVIFMQEVVSENGQIGTPQPSVTSGAAPASTGGAGPGPSAAAATSF